MDKKDGDNKVVLEKLQSYLKDKRSGDSSDSSISYSKPSTSYETPVNPVQTFEDGSNVLRQVLNYKKAALLRDPEITQVLKAISLNLKQKEK